MDLGTGLALLGSAQLAEKLLGPTATYMGEGLKTWTANRVANVRTIFQIAVGRLGDRINEEGSVPPKVLKAILSDGSYCDDPLTAEYFGGVLASSRTGVTRDDRGAAHLAQLSRLSAYQVRCHYIVYGVLKKLLNGSGKDFGLQDHRNEGTLFLPAPEFNAAMAYEETEDAECITPHCVAGLYREQLIEMRWATCCTAGDADNEFWKKNGPGTVVVPSMVGVELFLWAHGLGRVSLDSYLKKETVVPEIKGIALPPNSRLFSKMEAAFTLFGY